MAVPGRVNIVTLGVQDIRRSEAFYTALGWQRAAASQEQIVWFKLTGIVLGLFGYDALAEDAGLPAETRSRFSGVTLAINLESQAAVDAALAEALAAGGSVVKPGTKAEWGGYSGYFADPDGYLWEVAWNPFFAQGPDGLLQLE